MTETPSSTSGKEPIKASELDPKFKYQLIKMHGSEKILNVFSAEHAHQIVQWQDIVIVTAHEP